MATRALRLEDVEPGGSGRTGRWGGRVLLLIREPLLEVRWLHGDGDGTHVRVRQATELLALPVVPAWLVGSDLQRLHPTGDGITGSVEGRDPEAVDDVTRLHLERDWLADGNHELVGRDHLGLAVAVEVVLVRPPPLLPDDADLHRVGRRAADAEERGDGRDGDGEEDAEGHD